MESEIQALGMIEMRGAAAGLSALDSATKAAEVVVVRSELVCPGKFTALFTGQVAAVHEAVAAALACEPAAIYDHLVLGRVHPELLAGMAGRFAKGSNESALGIVETLTIASGFAAADRALKAAGVVLRNLRWGFSLGGRCFFVLEGSLSDVAAAVKTAEASAVAAGSLGGAQVIGRPETGVCLSV